MTNPKTGLLIFSLLLLGCNLVQEDAPPFDNPLDPDDPAFIPPETYIVSGPSEGETVNDHTVTIYWSGNAGVTAYSYQLNGGGWSSWLSDSSVTLSELDDGDYVFEVKGRYHITAEDETPEKRDFTIDAVQGPALKFFPRKVTMSQGTSFSLDLMTEDVTDVTAIYAEVQYNANILKLDSYSVLSDIGDYLVTNGGTVSRITENTSGSLKLNLVIVGGVPKGISGSGAVARLNFTVTGTNSTQVKLSNACTLIDKNLNDIALNQRVDCSVEVTNSKPFEGLKPSKGWYNK